MRHKLPMVVLAALLCATATTNALAYDPDWKRGRVYYRHVCTSCHMAQANQRFSPNEWIAYLSADKHANGKDTVKQYFSKSYRASIKGVNKAAEKFADVADRELMDDVNVFLIRSAKDGDAPASCN
jgi:hypothetical protein